MLSPITGKEMTVRRTWRKMTYRREEFDVCFHTWYCNDSQEEFEDEVFADLNYRQVINQYRVYHAIPTPEEIKNIREKYGLNKSQMSSVLGFGPNTYRQYESGEIPTEANARLIQLAENPIEFRRLLYMPNVLDEKALEKLQKHILILIEKEYSKREVRTIENYLFNGVIKSALTGFTKPDLQKFMQMVLFFSRMKPLKTKLNKLLGYADFTFFKRQGQSISGARYVAIDYGFVPEKFDMIYDYLYSEGLIDKSFKMFKNGNEGELFTPLSEFDSSLFSESELKIMNEIYQKFEKTSVEEIVALSHDEKVWLQNKNSHSKEINYFSAFDLIH